MVVIQHGDTVFIELAFSVFFFRGIKNYENRNWCGKPYSKLVIPHEDTLSNQSN